MMFSTQLEQYKGSGGMYGIGQGITKCNTFKEKFLKIFDFWSEQDQKQFVMLLIQEKLPTMKEHLEAIKDDKEGL